MMEESPKSSLLVFPVLAIAAFAVYFNSLDVPFYLDDFRNITENRYVRIDDLSPRTLYDAAFKSPVSTRPVANISFAFDYFLHQERVFGYHLVNTFIHMFTGFILYLVFSATLSTPALRDRAHAGRLAPFLASLLWLVHPLHTGSVTYIVQRMILLAALFYMLSMLCYIKGRLTDSNKGKWFWFSCSLVSALLALGSKEVAVTLPFAIILYEWFFLQDLDRKWLGKTAWLGVALIGFVFILYFIYSGDFSTILAGYEKRSFTVSERIFTEFRIVLLYISLLFFPSPGRLNLDHYVQVSRSLVDPYTTLGAAFALVLLLLFCFLAAKKRRILAFAILWYLGNLVLESSFLGLELIFEHRTYLPSVFLVFSLVCLVLEHVRARSLAVGLLAASIAVCSYWTVERNKMWKDPVLFWSDSAAKSPQKARPYMNLSVVLREQGKIDEAITASQNAIRIDPGFVNAYIGLGAAYVEKGEFSLAEAQYLKALQMMPDYAKVYNALGILYMKQGKMNRAIAAFNENLHLEPEDVNALVNRASVMALKGDIGAAIVDFRKALQLESRNQDILFNLAVAYTEIGELEKAVNCYEEILRFNPDDRQARGNLQLLRTGRAGQQR